MQPLAIEVRAQENNPLNRFHPTHALTLVSHWSLAVLGIVGKVTRVTPFTLGAMTETVCALTMLETCHAHKFNGWLKTSIKLATAIVAFRFAIDGTNGFSSSDELAKRVFMTIAPSTVFFLCDAIYRCRRRNREVERAVQVVQLLAGNDSEAPVVPEALSLRAQNRLFFKKDFSARIRTAVSLLFLSSLGTMAVCGAASRSILGTLVQTVSVLSILETCHSHDINGWSQTAVKLATAAVALHFGAAGIENRRSSEDLGFLLCVTGATSTIFFGIYNLCIKPLRIRNDRTAVAVNS